MGVAVDVMEGQMTERVNRAIKFLRAQGLQVYAASGPEGMMVSVDWKLLTYEHVIELALSRGYVEAEQ